MKPKSFLEPFSAYFSQGVDPFETVEWETRTAEIVNPTTGETVFKAENLEFPKTWSENCVSLVAEKYFRVVNGERETSVRQMIKRVAGTIARWGWEQGYFQVEEHAKLFEWELTWLLLHQKAAFNSPVWFNVGTLGDGKEQCSACFINSLEDDMSDILRLAQVEGKLYKGGSGSGVNYSKLRSSRERLSGGGYASGPVPFLAKDDANAGAIKSGGTTRRAAKMAILNVDHGDILEFIQCKAHGEKAAQALAAAGFSSDFRDRWGAYQLVPFQNANHSVRVTNAFMRAVEEDQNWVLQGRDGSIIEVVKARDLWDVICQAAWECGDPGVQFDDAINNMHTSPAAGRINGSNPCSEYMYLDDSACNLASLNLMGFSLPGNRPIDFDVKGFEKAVHVLITAMDILVEAASYPTEKIRENSVNYRPLGLGFTNLGGLLMSKGLAYDSHEGRSLAADISSLMTANAYLQSAVLAKARGPFAGYEKNADEMKRVLAIHQESTSPDGLYGAGTKINEAAHTAWSECRMLGDIHGYRNGQATVIAPAGTISFLMDCTTTGIEPELSLVKYKRLVGGGTIKIPNSLITQALLVLNYDTVNLKKITAYVAEHGTVIGSPIRSEHIPVFETSLPDPKTGQSIRPAAHVSMMAAVQPFISGAISKTVNLPQDATPKDISDIYRQAWSSGLKAIAVYRDGCKKTQPVSVKEEDPRKPEYAESDTAPEQLQFRKRLPNDIMSHRHKFNVGNVEGYIHVGLYPDGNPGELFIDMALAEGSTISGMMDTIAVLTSIALQYGVPLQALVDKFSYAQFEPSGITSNPNMRFAKSLVDYVFRWLGNEYVYRTEPEPDSVETFGEPTQAAPEVSGHTCGNCGNGVQRAGACLTCPTCGWTEGCG